HRSSTLLSLHCLTRNSKHLDILPNYCHFKQGYENSPPKMMSKLISTLLLISLTLVNFSAAFQYDVVCDHGVSASQCISTYGTYCSQRGVLLNQAPSGLDCTTNRSQEPQGGNYCYCKFHYVAAPKATANFNPNEILQQRGEVSGRAAEAAAPLAAPTFDPNQILQWARGLDERKIATAPLATPTFDPNTILQWARDLQARDVAAAPLATPTFDPNQILRCARDAQDTSADENDVRNQGQHFKTARQLPSGALNSASSILASLSSVIASPPRSTTSATSTPPASSTISTTSTHSATATSTITPVLPPKSEASARRSWSSWVCLALLLLASL
ncbi:hypothetical protein BKA65DRAFT_566322, partial [Rhexocercosporidium sp. MPI-PUGE-AT-0058]